MPTLNAGESTKNDSSYVTVTSEHKMPYLLIIKQLSPAVTNFPEGKTKSKCGH